MNPFGIDLRCYEDISTWGRTSPEPAFMQSPTSSDSETISMQTLNEFYNVMYYYDTPAERFQNLCNICTRVAPDKPESQPYYEVWLDIPNEGSENSVTMDLVIRQDKYDSQCFEADPHYGDEVSYHYIEALFEENSEQMYFQIRIDSLFKVAEILHIQSGPQISGSKVKSICMAIINYIYPQCTYLHDDAKVQDIALRVLLPVASREVKTWYTPDGFTLCTCDYVTDQVSTKYSDALELIRNTALSSLRNLPKLQSWKRRYFEDPLDKSLTVHHLANAIYLKSKEPAHKNAAIQDLGDFYKQILTRKLTCEPDKFQEALAILDEYQLWHKLT